MCLYYHLTYLTYMQSTLCEMPSWMKHKLESRLPGEISVTSDMQIHPNGRKMWELDHDEGWVLKNWCFWTVVLEKTLESPLDCKEIQPVHSEGHQPWDFFGRNDAEAETPLLWPPHGKSWLIRKNSDAGKDWRQEKGMRKDVMVGWHHQLNGHEFEQVLGDGEGLGSLACCSPWGHKESGTTEPLKNNNNEKMKNIKQQTLSIRIIHKTLILRE